jgi:hypothetical protein
MNIGRGVLKLCIQVTSFGKMNTGHIIKKIVAMNITHTPVHRYKINHVITKNFVIVFDLFIGTNNQVS